MSAGFDGRMYWQSLKDGRQARDPDCDESGSAVWTVRLGDWVGCEIRLHGADQGPLKIHDYVTGKTETVAPQANRKWSNAISPTQVLATEKRADGWLGFRLLGRENEPRKDVPVATAEQVAGAVVVRASDEKGALVGYDGTGGAPRLGLVDYGTATLRPIPLPAGVSSPFDLTSTTIGPKWVALHEAGKVTLISRSDPGVTRTVTVDESYARVVLPIDDWLLTAGMAYPLSGGASPVPLAVTARMVAGADGKAYALGATDRAHWSVVSIAPEAQGIPRTREVLPVPYKPADRMSLALGQGDLSIGQNDGIETVQGYQTSVSGPVSVSPTPTWSCDGTWKDEVCSSTGNSGGWNVATGDGRLVALSTGSDTKTCGLDCVVVVHVQETHAGPANHWVWLPSTTRLQADHIVSASGRYLFFVAWENSVQRLLVADIDAGKILDVKASSPAVLWGSTLWQPEGDKGVVAGTDLRTGQVTQRVDLGSGCRPYELHVSGDWFYSTCSFYGDAAAVYHVPAKKRIPLPFTPERHSVQLGDGFVVHEAGAGLEVTNVRSGAAVREHDVASFIAGFGVDWTIDRFGGRLAYTDASEAVHLVGVTGAASPLAAIDQSVPTALDAKKANGWQARWWLSKPAASWQLTVRNKETGITTPVRGGGEARGVVTTSWDGKDKAGKYLPNGAYDWTLTAQPADGQGAALTATGAVALSGAGAGPRDFVGDGYGDLFGFKADGTADFLPGGPGAFGAAVSGSGWTGDNAVNAVLPFGDVDNDGCNDVLVRTTAGALRAYRPGCGQPLTPASPYTVIGLGGWNAYDTLIAPGDLTGDGRTDLLARNNTTGQLYMYALKGAGPQFGLSSKALIAEGMQGYLLAGARDLNGDGRGDMVGRDPSGKLWFYPGRSDGKLAPRVEIGTGWQIFNALVGVGDITGDGKSDLVARDTAGALWRYVGRGNGTFEKRVKISDGWGTYASLS
ncbi:FG-GAP-like repeat-containing protein [Streptomyces sp. NPDC060028]|uniref:FG-GAP-like repeat-containing protein n=1 Tax=Streptomyces sp. NPDC060028 TaxID=3347041 RepID=UPI00367998CA